MHSVSILIEVLEDYEGTFIVVSHDRHFLSCIANKIWWIEDQKVREYPGTYEEFEASQKLLQQQKNAENSKAKSVAKEQKAQQQKVHQQQSAAAKSTISDDQKREQRKVKQRFDKVEEELKSLNDRKTQLEATLADPAVFGDPSRFEKELKSFNELEALLTTKSAEWESLFEQLSKFE
jgi:ATP-binding cassette subfamily F protein 3